MKTALRIGALDIAEAISAKIGSYVDMNFMQFLAVEGDHIQCWYMNAGGNGPTFEIDMRRSAEGWTLHLTEHPAGTDQEFEVP
jgi:hypothetical protein